MSSLATLLGFAFLLATGAPTSADGKIYWRDIVPPHIPYQRAILWFDNATETLLLQSRYDLPDGSPGHTIGWVVPVPAVPELASMPADEAQAAFTYLAMTTGPRVTRIKDVLGAGLAVLLLLLPVIVVFLVLVTLLSYLVSLPSWFRRLLRLPPSPHMSPRRDLMEYVRILSVVWVVLLIPAFLLMPTFGSSLNILREQHVGVYDVRVVASTDASELVSWLNENEFQFTDADEAVFDDYISAGWSFVVANVSSSADTTEEDVISMGLVAPLILRFPSAVPVYPLALTATAGRNTEVLLYVVSDHKATSDDRLTLEYAYNREDRLHVMGYLAGVEPEGFFDRESTLSYLTKFNGVLTPFRMQQDLVLARAANDHSYRERIVRW
jgi:hypothetical protein